jgi:hypothetical protein
MADGTIGRRNGGFAALAMKLIVASALVALVAAAPSAASTPPPAAYRAKLNSVCRGFTTRMKADWKKMAKAEKAKDYEAYAYAYGHNLGLILQQDAVIEAAPVPAQIRRQMRPILRLFVTADRHIRLALRYAQKGDVTRFLAETDKIGEIARPGNKLLDRAGLRDCGSNQ